jgi:hypothetical protein
MSDRKDPAAPVPAERANPGPVTHAENAAGRAPHTDAAEKRRVAEDASREEDA